jgi:hypothetical protein
LKIYCFNLKILVWYHSFTNILFHMAKFQLQVAEKGRYRFFPVFWTTNEPRHDKTNIMGLRIARIQTSLRIRTVWSGPMLFAISFSTCNRVCKRTAWILIRLRGCAAWSWSMLVANALRWFCYDAAQILFSTKNNINNLDY